MEFHAGNVTDTQVEIMACTETTCAQIKVAVTADEVSQCVLESKSIGDVVVYELGRLLAVAGESACLDARSLAAIRQQLKQ